MLQLCIARPVKYVFVPFLVEIFGMVIFLKNDSAENCKILSVKELSNFTAVS